MGVKNLFTCFLSPGRTEEGSEHPVTCVSLGASARVTDACGDAS